jgi:stress response protein YsnF
VVAKTARVVEEVRVGKEVREREETIEDSVRRKDVDVERIAGQAGRVQDRERAVASDADLQDRNKTLGRKDKPTL